MLIRRLPATQAVAAGLAGMRLPAILHIVGSCLELAMAGKVLVVHPLPLYSHTMPFVPLFRALAEKGHQVTFVSPLAQKLAFPNFTNIAVKFGKDEMAAAFRNLQKKDIQGFWYEFFGSWRLCSEVLEVCLSVLKDVLPPPSEKFDLVIIEPFFCQQPLVALGRYYGGAPVVATNPGPMTPTIAYHTGNPTLPSYVPNIRWQISTHLVMLTDPVISTGVTVWLDIYRYPFKRTPMTDHMDFWGRMKNVAITAMEILALKFYALNRFDKAMKEWLDIPNIPHIEHMLNNVSLVLVDTHYSLNYARPYARNILEVGGLSIKVADTLPDDLEKFISEAEHGVIYFSLGSNIDGIAMGKFLINTMESFKYVKQRVLFKIDNFEFHEVPSNVLIKPWFPQPSILSHKNVVLFISHGGLNSIYEAAYHGVPVLGTPFYVDQPHNILLLQQIGVGLYLDPESVTDPTVMVTAIHRVLGNSSYREAARRRSEITKDHPIPLLDEGVYWIEYVMKYGGAPHLRPAVLDLAWYQILFLDLIGFILGIGLLVVAVLYCTIKHIIKLPYASSKSRKKKRQ